MILRDNYIKQIQQALKSVSICVLIGCRQTGKTTLMEMLPVSGKKIFLNGQDPTVAGLFKKYAAIESYLKFNLNRNLNGTILIDEFQYIPGISTSLKLLTDRHKTLKIICSGSSSIDIAQTVEESLAGRIRIIPVYSLSFAEFVLFHDEKLFRLYQNYSIHDDQAIVDKALTELMYEYLLYGGLPRVVLTPSIEEKTALLNDFYQTYLLRDVRSYVKNEDFVGFNKLLQLLSAQIGSMVNINNLSKTTMLPYKKCEEYLSLLEQMYVIKLVQPFTSNKSKEITKMKKVYFYDTGMRNLIYGSFSAMDVRVDNGAIFENYVYLELLKRMKGLGTVQYYRTKDGMEIDFVVNDLKKKFAVEVKFKNFKNPTGSLKLAIFARENRLFESHIVNLNCNDLADEVQYVPGIFAGKI